MFAQKELIGRYTVFTIYLISGLTEQSEIDQEKAKTIKSEIVSHWHPNLTINLGSFTSFLTLQ